MPKLTKSLFKDNFFIVALGITISIAYLSLMKMPKVEVNISNIDKFYHSFAYFTLSFCWLFSFYKKPKLKNIIVISCIIYGIVIEVLQDTLTMYRTGDFRDVLANTVGIVLGLFIYNQIFKKI